MLTGNSVGAPGLLLYPTRDTYSVSLAAHTYTMPQAGRQESVAVIGHSLVIIQVRRH